MGPNWLDRLMAPLVEWWDKRHGYPREWDNNYWTFTNRMLWFWRR